MRATITAALASAVSLMCAHGCQNEPADTPRVDDSVQPIEVRFHEASDDAAKGWPGHTRSDGNVVYVAPSPFVTTDDIEKTWVTDDRRSRYSGKFVVALLFRERSVPKISETTRRLIEQPIAVFLNDELVDAPVLHATLGDRCQLPTSYTTRDEAERVAAGILRASKSQ